MTSRFTLSLHILGFLTWYDERCSEPVTSKQLAESINTNPVVVRRLLGDLRKAGLVETRRGAGGGVTLCCPPEAISLRRVYEAVEDAGLFSLHPNPPDQHCFVGGHIEHVLQGVFGDAEEALKRKLAGMTVADLHADVVARAEACGCRDLRFDAPDTAVHRSTTDA